MADLNLVFLAGGSSSRFHPLKQKNLYRFLGKNVAEIQVRKVIEKLKPARIFVISNEENNDELKRQLEKVDYSISVRIQEGQGMSGATLTGIKDLPSDDDILVLNMIDFYDDQIFDEFNKMHKTLRSNSECMVTGKIVQKYFPGGYLVFDENGFVVKVVEKPGEGNEPSSYVRIVFDYFSNVEKLRDHFSKANSDSDDVYEVAQSNMMTGGIKFRMLEYNGRWTTIKYPWHVLDVMNFFLENIKGQVIAEDVIISKNAVINGNVIIESGTKIYDGAVINGPVYIGKNSVIANNSLVRNSMIGDDCVVGFDTEVARSYLLGKVWTHKNYIGDSVIEENVSFGSNAVTANLRLDEGEVSVSVKGNKINTTLTKLGAIVASNVRFGVGCLLMPGVKVGSGSFVGSGVVLDTDVESNKYIYNKQDLVIKENHTDIANKSREKFKTQI